MEASLVVGLAGLIGLIGSEAANYSVAAAAPEKAIVRQVLGIVQFMLFRLYG